MLDEEQYIVTIFVSTFIKMEAQKYKWPTSNLQVPSAIATILMQFMAIALQFLQQFFIKQCLYYFQSCTICLCGELINCYLSMCDLLLDSILIIYETIKNTIVKSVQKYFIYSENCLYFSSVGEKRCNTLGKINRRMFICLKLLF